MSEPWISFDVHYTLGKGCTYYGPGMYWLLLPNNYTVEQMEEFKKRVFRYAVQLAKEEVTPILTYPGGKP